MVMEEALRVTEERVGYEGMTGAEIKKSLETLENIDMKEWIPPLSFSPTSHRGSRGLKMARFENGSWSFFTDFIILPETLPIK